MVVVLGVGGELVVPADIVAAGCDIPALCVRVAGVGPDAMGADAACTITTALTAAVPITAAI